jgi:hypothetical protein
MPCADVSEMLALASIAAYSCDMQLVRNSVARKTFVRNVLVGGMFCSILLARAAGAPAKVHVVAFGKWTTAQWFTDSAPSEHKVDSKNDDSKNSPLTINSLATNPQTIKIRALIIDGRVKEYTLGAPHEVTERLFVVRRVFRVNDSLPEESAPRWQWQRGGWLLVDRMTGRISAINLPEFDAYYSSASWYRDYVAYCGVADDGKKTYAMVAQLSRRKPVLKKELSNIGGSSAGVAEDVAPDSACPAPAWQRGPVRVSFEAAGVVRQTFAIRGHVVDVVNDAEEEEEGR